MGELVEYVRRAKANGVPITAWRVDCDGERITVEIEMEGIVKEVGNGGEEGTEGEGADVQGEPV